MDSEWNTFTIGICNGLSNAFAITREELDPGSIDGIAGLTSDDGRVLILMPHPGRVIRGVSNTWGTFLGGAGFGHEAGWMTLFHNARVWVQNQ